MTNKQQEVLDALRSFIERYGYSPSITDLMAEVGTTSRNRVQNALTSLRDEGKVVWTNGAYRTLRLVEHGADVGGSPK